MATTGTDVQGFSSYFPVSPLKFSLMSLCTCGLYEMFWSYKNWRRIKIRDKSEISPVWRAFFYPFWHYSLLADIAERRSTGVIRNKLYRLALAISLIIICYSWRAPDPYWLLCLLTFVPMLPAVYAIAEINALQETPPSQNPHTFLNFAAYLFVSPILAFSVLLTIGYFPNTMVVPGESLWERDIRYLRSQEILAEDEQIIYFYSAGLTSIKSDGQFISEEYVTSYWLDPDDGVVYTAFATYEEIEDVSVDWSDSWLEDTRIRISTGDDLQFELWVSADSGGDKKFVYELKRLWRAKRAAVGEHYVL